MEKTRPRKFVIGLCGIAFCAFGLACFPVKLSGLDVVLSSSQGLTLGESMTITVRPVPEDAEFSPHILWISGQDNGEYEAVYDSDLNQYVITVKGTSVGSIEMQFYDEDHGDEIIYSDEVEIAVSNVVYEEEPAKSTNWTIMYYSDADNDLEDYLMADIQEMEDGISAGDDVNIILLVDRVAKESDNSTALGSNFTDTRLYRVLPNGYWRLDGGTQMPKITTSSTYEANMGDANTLEDFVEYCKANYPAQRYALFISNHGGGGAKAMASSLGTKSLAYDSTSDDDTIFSAEISDVLDKEDSVDLLVMDACLMASAEQAYQYRPGNGSFEADYLVASAAAVWGYGLPYDAIFKEIGDSYPSTSSLEPSAFATLIVDKQEESTSASSGETFAVIDMAKIAAVKTSMDELSQALAADDEARDSLEALRGSGDNVPMLNYIGDKTKTNWLYFPYFDIYDLADAVAGSEDFSDDIQSLAETLASAVDACVLQSFGNGDYSGFSPGKNGLSIFFPDGSGAYNSTYKYWDYQVWYNPNAVTNTEVTDAYGKIAWCLDGATANDKQVDNWFELLDYWFDGSDQGLSNPANGYNGYAY